MHRSRIIILVGAAVAGLALFLPFVDLPVVGTINGFDGDGWPATALLAVPALMALVGDRAEGFSGTAALVAVAVSALAVLFAVFKLIDANDAISAAGAGSLGAGVWILLIATLVTLAGSVMSLSRKLG